MRFYESADPDKLLDKLNEKKELLQSVLPELRSLQNTISNQSNIEIFRGAKGVSTILSDVFKNSKNVKYFGSYTLSKEVLKHLPGHF